MKNNKFTLRMSDNVRQSIADEAKRTERSEAYVVNKILEQYFSIEQETKPTKQPPKPVKPKKDTKPQQKKQKPVKQAVNNREAKQLTYLQQRIKELEKGK